MKKILALIALAGAMLFTCHMGLAQNDHEYYTLPYHEPFDLRDSPDKDHPDPALEDTPLSWQIDPNFYRSVKSRWKFWGIGQGVSAWTGEVGGMGTTDAVEEPIDFYANDNAEGGYYTAGCLRNRMNDPQINDWLIMGSPVRIDSACHVLFSLKGGTYTDDIPVEVWYGETPAPTDADGQGWRKLGTATIPMATPGEEEAWTEFMSNTLRVEETKYYYFAVRINFARNEGLHFVRLDEFYILPGQSFGVPDIALKNIVLPPVGCDMTAESEVGVEVKNVGSCTIEGVICTLNVYRGEETRATTVYDTIRTEITGGATQILTLNKGIDLSQEGNYTVYCDVDVLPSSNYAEEENMDNNSANASTIHMAPMTVPVSFDFFRNNKKDLIYWHCDGDGWFHSASDDFADSWRVQKENEYLVSTCMDLEAGEYIFRWKYEAGRSNPLLPDIISREDFKILLGRDGDPSGWTVIKNAEQVYHSGANDYELFRFSVAETGTYQIAFVNTGSNARSIGTIYEKLFAIYAIHIDEAGPDLGVADFYGDYLNYRTPGEHLLPEIPVSVVVINQGIGNQLGNVEVKFGELSVGTSDNFRVNEGDTVTVEMSVAIPGEVVAALPDNETHVLSAKVNIIGNEDSYSANDIYNYRFYVTDETWSADRTNGIQGSLMFPNYGGMVCPLYLQRPDTVTAITLGFNANNAWKEAQFRLSIRSVEATDEAEKKLGVTYYSQLHTRAKTTGEVIYRIPPMILPAGMHAIVVEQLNGDNPLMIAADFAKGSESKGMYLSSDGKYIRRPAAASENYGNGYIRVSFGHDAEVSAIDLAVTEIIKPLESGYFTANQPVIATVENLGADDVENLSVYCAVDDKVYETKIGKLAAAESTEVSFEADLSRIGKRMLRVYTAVAADKNRQNDTVSLLVVSQELQDPYVLDFEYCAHGAFDAFNPGWKAVDEDGLYSWGISGLEFRGLDEPFAFMVLNSSLNEDLAERYPPYNGDKVALSISPSADESVGSDWLISPKLKLGEGASMSFSIFQEGLENNMDPSEWEVYVSVSGDELSDFAKAKLIATAASELDYWKEVKAGLEAYAGQEVYIGIKLTSYKKSYVSLIDNIRVEKGKVGNQNGSGNIEVKVYPNPASDFIGLSASEELREVELFSASGQSVHHAYGIGRTDYRIGVEGFVPGVYFVKVATRSGISIEKVVVR